MATFTGYFSSRRGEQWTVTVVSANGSESRSLALASDPLNIEMDDNDDILSPVRLITGYLRVKGYKEELYPTMGSQNTVLLTKNSGSTVGWRGYIQPFAYDINVVRHSSDVYDIPVECPLSALGHIDLPISQLGDFPSFGEILYCIMNCQANVWSYVYMPLTVEGSNVLSCRIDRRMLEDSESGESKYTCLEFIEEFCRFFGYCCRYDGNDGMVFTHIFKQLSSFSYISKSNLGNSSTGSNWIKEYYPTLTGDSVKFASKNQSIQYINGWRKVKVNSDVAKSTVTLFEMPNNWLRDQLYGSDVVHGSSTVDDYVTNEAVASKTLISFSHDGWHWDFSLAANKDQYTIKSGARLILLNYSSGKQPQAEWNPAIEVAGSNTVVPMFKLTSQREYSLNKGLLVISATTYTRYNHVKYSGNGQIALKVRYGGYYYNYSGNSWSTNDTWFVTSIGTENRKENGDTKDSTGQINSTVSNIDSRLNYRGGLACQINLNSTNVPVTHGQIEIDICTVNLSNASSYGDNQELCIEDLKVEFLPDGMKNTAFDDKDESYVYDTGGAFRTVKEISVTFASDKYKISGENSIFYNNYQLASTLPFYYDNTEQLQPEYFVAKYAGIFGQRTHQILDIEIDAYETGWCKPLTILSNVEPSGKTWWVISVDKDFANCTQRIRAIEL